MRRPTVLHVTTSDISLALLLGPQLRAFRDAGFEVVGASAPGPYVRELERSGIRHHALEHATRAMRPYHDALALAELRRLFRELSPDVVHTHNPKPGVYGRLAARSVRVPAVVNTVHGLYAQPHDRLAKRALVYGLERLAATCSHAELVQNPEDLHVLRRLGVPAQRLHLLGNGVDLDRFDPDRVGGRARVKVRAELGFGTDDVVCGVVGRLVWEKGYREVFDAARHLARRAPGVRMVVVGPHEPEKADGVGEADIADAARAGNITFLGGRDDMERLYAAMDMFVLASHREGFPRAAMEAAAMRLPVIATDVRGCRQVVDDSVTGRLVPVRDAAALADAIADVAADAVARRALGDAGRRKALREFDERRVISLTLSVYERVLGRRSLRAVA